MNAQQLGLADVSLMTGERIESSLTLHDSSENSSGSDDKPSLMLLTDQRVIHIHGNGKGRKAVFASLHDISVVEISEERSGYSAYIWAGLAFIVSIALWQVIDNPLGSIAAAILVGLMGVYLIADNLMSPGRPMLVFKTGSSEFRCNLPTSEASPDIYDFINRLFQLKSENGASGSVRTRRFSPR